MNITSDAATQEADRVIRICNACRYCEGLCATFQAMTNRREFTSVDLHYLANLCHNCTACYHDCQFAPPHEFKINVPVALSDLRLQSYRRHTWPPAVGEAFSKNALLMGGVTTLSIIILLSLAFLLIGQNTIFGIHQGSGAFYRIVKHDLMVAFAALTFGFSLIAMGVGFIKFWRSQLPDSVSISDLISAIKNSATLRYLDGGHGKGCSSIHDQASNLRRYYHQFTMWGFFLCFAATCVATFYDYVLDIQAPYSVLSLPVILGLTGGVGLLIGPVGLFWNKLKSNPATTRNQDIDYAFLASLFLVSLTGLLLLALRETNAMGMLLLIHLGFVLGLFLMFPYSKFVHGMYRYIALVKFSTEQRNSTYPKR